MLKAAAQYPELRSLSALSRHFKLNRQTIVNWMKADSTWNEDLTFALSGIRAGGQEIEVPDRERFRQDYFGHDTPEHQRRWFEFIDSHDISLILVPPEAGKTTSLIEECVYQIIKDRNIRIMYVGSNREEARKRLEAVKDRLTSSEFYDANGLKSVVRDFGPFTPRAGEKSTLPWTADYFTVTGRTSGEKDYCVDEETEILTRERGWVTHDRLAAGDEVLALDTSTGRSKWEPVRAVHRFEAREREMIWLDTHSHSSLTTPDHRWWVNHAGEWQWRTSESLTPLSKVPMASEYKAPVEAIHDDALVELVAWSWTEGSLNVRSPQNWVLEIGQSHRVNPDYVERIRSCIEKLFGPAVQGRRDGSGWHERRLEERGMTLFRLNTDAAKFVSSYMPDKCVSPKFLSELTKHQLDLFVETSLDADGWRGAMTAIAQVDERRIRAFEVALVLAGRPFATHRQKQGWHTTLYRKGKGFASPVGALKQRKESRAWYTGMVWCPETPSGTWCARRNGTAYFTGNTMQSLGLRGRIYGTRLDLIILDDIVEDIVSEAERERHISWILGRVQTRLSRGGKLVIIGTRVHEYDIYAQFLSEDSEWSASWAKMVMPAIDDDGKSFWPAYWPVDELVEKRQKKMRVRDWNLVYQQQSTGMPDAPFSLESIERCKDLGHFLGQVIPGNPVVMGVDPALEGTLAVTVLQVDRTTGERWIVDCIARTAIRHPDHVKNLLVETAQRYGAARCNIEKNAMQGFLSKDYDLKRRMLAVGCQIEEEHTDRSNKFDPQWGVSSVAAQFDAGMYHIPTGPGSDSSMRPLLEELAAWRPGAKVKQDRVMSLWLAELAARRFGTYRPGLPTRNPNVPAWVTRRQVPRWASRRRIAV